MIHLNINNNFACIEEIIGLVRLNIVVAEEHVGEIERLARTVKEDRCHVHICPYERYTIITIVGCVVKNNQRSKSDTRGE